MVKVMITLAIMMTSFEHGAESMAKDVHAPSFNIAFVNPDTEKLQETWGQQFLKTYSSNRP